MHTMKVIIFWQRNMIKCVCTTLAFCKFIEMFQNAVNIAFPSNWIEWLPERALYAIKNAEIWKHFYVFYECKMYKVAIYCCVVMIFKT